MGIHIIHGFSIAILALTLSACGGSSSDPNNPPEPITYTGNENQAIITKINAAKLIAQVSQAKDLASSDPITPSRAIANNTKKTISLAQIIKALSNSRVSHLSASIDGYAAKNASRVNNDCDKSGSFAAGDNGLFRFYSCDDNKGVILNGGIRVLGNKQTYSVEYLGYTMSFIGTGPDYDAVVELGGTSAWHYNAPDAATQVDITLNTVIKNYVSGSQWLTKNYVYTEVGTTDGSPYTVKFTGNVYDSVLGFVSVSTAPLFQYTGTPNTNPSDGGLEITGAAPTSAGFEVNATAPNDVAVNIKPGPNHSDTCNFQLTWTAFNQAVYTCNSGS